jgi:hypothetical protein
MLYAPGFGKECGRYDLPMLRGLTFCLLSTFSLELVTQTKSADSAPAFKMKIAERHFSQRLIQRTSLWLADPGVRLKSIQFLSIAAGTRRIQ